MIGLAIGAGAGLLSGLGSFFGGRSAAKDLEAKLNEMKASMNEAYAEIQGFADDYVGTVDRLITNFDPYDVEDAFNSLYEAVIQPMERDFDENVLPGIQAAYSGGVMGAGAGFSGAQAEAESKAQRGQAETKAQLRHAERGQAVDTNFRQLGIQLGAEGGKFDVSTQAPMLKANMAGQIFGGESDVIAAKTAANQSLWNMPMTIGQGAMAGHSLQSALGGGAAPQGDALKPRSYDMVRGSLVPNYQDPAKTSKINW